MSPAGEFIFSLPFECETGIILDFFLEDFLNCPITWIGIPRALGEACLCKESRKSLYCQHGGFIILERNAYLGIMVRLQEASYNNSR